MTSHELAIKLLRLSNKELDINFIDTLTHLCSTLEIDDVQEVNDVIEISLSRT